MPGPRRPPASPAPAPAHDQTAQAAASAPAGYEAPRGGLCPVLVGPTAVGKTALVLALAARAPIEVISLDSRQIYRGMRIGTAQPTVAEQAVVPHHLIDFVPPAEAYSAARFRRDFERAYREIRARGRVPLLVGGAGLYLSALQEGLFDLPGVDPARTAAIRAELAPLPAAEIRVRLQALDPDSWRRLHPSDRYRAQRALEIRLATGRTMTELMAEQPPRPALGLRFEVVRLTLPRPQLHDRIAARTDAMLAGGWVDEVEGLITAHGAGARGLRAIGYREIVASLEGRLPASELRDRIVTATRQYGKRQETWFRAASARVVGMPGERLVAEALGRLVEETGKG